jgi:hypothetical protein
MFVKLEFYIWTKLRLVGGLKLKEDKVRQSIKQTNKSAYKKQNHNETALATIVIVPDDGPVWPKHVVLV